jgi:hypothetical protein
VTTKGVWYPDKSKATEKDPPLYLHISATTQEILDKAVKRINDLIAADLGPLVEDRRKEFGKVCKDDQLYTVRGILSPLAEKMGRGKVAYRLGNAA